MLQQTYGGRVGSLHFTVHGARGVGENEGAKCESVLCAIIIIINHTASHGRLRYYSPTKDSRARAFNATKYHMLS